VLIEAKRGRGRPPKSDALTNAQRHLLMRCFAKLGAENRSVVILRPEQY
jgi:AT hook motif